MNMKVGDYVKYNGYNYETFYDFDKIFIKDNLTIGKSYIILEVILHSTFSYLGIKIPWYQIKCNNNKTYWLPYICFDIDMKKKYDLR